MGEVRSCRQTRSVPPPDRGRLGGGHPQTREPSMVFLPQEVILRKRDGEALTADEIAQFIAGFADGTVSATPRPPPSPWRSIFRDMNHDRARGADRGDARQRHRARLVRSRWPGGRQAFDRRRRRQCLADAGADPRRLRRLCADDLGPRPRPYRRHARQVRLHPRLHDAARQRAVPQGGARRPAAPSSARPPTSRPPTRLLYAIRDVTGDGRIHPADHRLDPLQEARGRPRRADPRRQDRLGRLHADAGEVARPGRKPRRGRQRRRPQDRAR